MRGQRWVDKESEPFQIGQQYIYFNYSSQATGPETLPSVRLQPHLPLILRPPVNISP
jgi:hypothetical protein